MTGNPDADDQPHSGEVDTPDAAVEGPAPFTPPAVTPTAEVAAEACATTLSAAEARAKVLAGEALEGVLVEDLDLTDADVEHPVAIRRSRLVNLRCPRAVFRKDVDFTGSTFVGNTTLGHPVEDARPRRRWRPEEGAHFEGDLDCQGCLFLGPLYASGIRVAGNARFREVEFRRFASFHAAEFGGKLWIVRAHAAGAVSFWEAIFSGELADFSSSRFDGAVVFCRALSHHRFSVYGSDFAGDLDMFRFRAGTETLFVNARVQGRLDLSRSIHPHLVDLRQATVAGTISFHALDSPRLLLTRRHVDGHLDSLEQARPAKLVQADFGFLKNIFEANNDYRAMDWAYYHYAVWRRRARRLNPLSRFLEWFVLDLGSGYGTKPFNIAILVLTTILVFTGVFACCPDAFFFNGELDSLQAIAPGATWPAFGVDDALYTSASTFAVGGYGDWVARPGTGMRFWMTLESRLGLFLTALFVAMLTRKIIR